jgi:hypothetical protein
LLDQAAVHRFYFQHWNLADGTVHQPGASERDPVRRLLRASSDPCFAVFLVPRIVQISQDGYEYLVFREATFKLATVACALERHRLRCDAYPQLLGELVPDGMPSVPCDPVTGEPLRYRAENGGYLLYSVGLNAQDDHGRPPPDPRADRGGPRPTNGGWDWVWRRETVAGAP